jgi:hypothetical protein
MLDRFRGPRAALFVGLASCVLSFPVGCGAEGPKEGATVKDVTPPPEAKATGTEAYYKSKAHSAAPNAAEKPR